MQSIFLYLGALLLSMACGVLFIPMITKFCLEKGLFDMPNARKVHKNPIPRLGGMAFVPSMLLVSIIVLFILSRKNGNNLTISLWSAYFCISLFIIYFIGIIDDLIGLNATVKFTIEIVATIIMPISGLYINNLYGLFGIYTIPFWVGAPLTVLIMVFACNAMNLIDGIDGLSSSLTVISLAGFFVGFYSEHLYFYCILIASLSGVILAYMYFNIFGKVEKKEKIFMGDSGSLSLGFILSFLAIKYCMDTPNVNYDPTRIMWSWTFLAIPCFDVVRVFFFRLLHHRSPFQPDKNHIHHKMMAAGLSQHQALLAILSLDLLIIAVNALLSENLSLLSILITDILLYCATIAIVNVITKKKSNAIDNNITNKEVNTHNTIAYNKSSQIA